MKSAILKVLLFGVLLVAGASPVFAGAPAGFTLHGTEVRVNRSGDSAEVRITYDLTVNETACGWFMAEFDALPAGAQEPTAVLILDGKEFPAHLMGGEGTRQFQVFQKEKEEGRRALEGAKSIRFALDFPKTACAGAEMTLAVPLPRSYVHRKEGRSEGKNEVPDLSVRFDVEVEGMTSGLRATFRSAPAGARVVLRADSRSAAVSLLP